MRFNSFERLLWWSCNKLPNEARDAMLQEAVAFIILLPQHVSVLQCCTVMVCCVCCIVVDIVVDQQQCW